MSEPSVLLVTKGLDIGGLERVVVDLAVAMRRRGVNAEVAFANDRRDALVPRLVAEGVHVHPLGGSDMIGVGAAWRLHKLARQRRFSVVHAHGPLPSVAVRLVTTHAAIVTTSHTVWRALRPSTRLLLRATAWRDAATTAVSAVVAASIPGRSGRLMHVIPHGVDEDAIEAARSAAGRSVEGPLRLITVASHREVKNYPNLLLAVSRAVSEGADIRLLAVGDGPSRARHEALARDLGIGDIVEFRSATPDVLTLMAAADVLVVASDFEGQPMVVVEALALGLAVVATAVGRVPELVTPGLGRVVRPGDAAALGRAIAAEATRGRRGLQPHVVCSVDDTVDAYSAVWRAAAER